MFRPVLADYLMQLADLCSDLAKAVIEERVPMNVREQQKALAALVEAHRTVLDAREQVEGMWREEEMA